MEAPNERIVRTGEDTGVVYGVKKCAEIWFKREEMIKGEGLVILDKKAEALDLEKGILQIPGDRTGKAD